MSRLVASLRKSDHISFVKGGEIFTTGYADYYLGSWRDQVVGIKVPSGGRSTRKHSVSNRIQTERTIWSRLKHEHILPLYAFVDGTSGFSPLGGFIYPWCFFGDAERFLETHGHLMTLDERIELWEGVVEGMNYLHSQKDPIIHGCLEPCKILIDSNGSPRISNFSLSRVASSETRICRYILAEIGAPEYLAPELLVEKEVLVTVESDIWALGAVALFVVLLQEPFEESTRRHRFVNGKHVEALPAYPTLDLSPALEPFWTLLTQCWDGEPSSRPTSLQILEFMERQKEDDITLAPQELLARIDAPCLSGSLEIPHIRPLFSGTYSNVYRGYYDKKPVAVKVLRVVGTLGKMRKKVCRERRVWAMLEHPNILPLLGYADEEEMFQPLGALISPWCKYGDAGQFIGEHGSSLTLQVRVQLWKGVIDGVAYLHSRERPIIHGDLKPGNILIDDEGKPRLCDFGLSRILAAQDLGCTTTTSDHTGTPRYLSYELVRGDISYPDKGSDIFSVGCVGLEFTFLRQPYANRRNNLRGEIFNDIKRFVAPSERPESARDDLWTAVSSCWNQHSGDRPQAIELSSFLEHFEPFKEEHLSN